MPTPARKKSSLNLILILAALSVLLCWWYGIGPLALGIYALRKVFQYKKMKQGMKDTSQKKLRWAQQLAITGIVFSGMFTIYYFTALLTGAWIRPF